MTTSKMSEGTTSSMAPKYPKYSTESARLTSFDDCGDIMVLPKHLTTAGFFYAGFGDCVRCFHCGLGLRHWSDDDDPWIEHCKWSKDCLFVNQMKGQEFVIRVQMAVQYSQNQNRDDRIPNVNDTAGLTVSASILVEKILELEDGASNSTENDQLVRGTPLVQPNTKIAPQSTESNNKQRPSLETFSNHASTQSVADRDISSTSISSESDRGEILSFQSSSDAFSLYGTDDILDMYHENQRMKDQLYCMSCKMSPREVVFLSCPFPHLLFCNFCYLRYDVCPLCFTPVKALLNVRR